MLPCQQKPRLLRARPSAQEQHVASYQDHVSDAWSGRIRDSLEYTFEDVLGDRNVSLAEVQAACALVRGAGGEGGGNKGLGM